MVVSLVVAVLGLILFQGFGELFFEIMFVETVTIIECVKLVGLVILLVFVVVILGAVVVVIVVVVDILVLVLVVVVILMLMMFMGIVLLGIDLVVVVIHMLMMVMGIVLLDIDLGDGMAFIGFVLLLDFVFVIRLMIIRIVMIDPILEVAVKSLGLVFVGLGISELEGCVLLGLKTQHILLVKVPERLSLFFRYGMRFIGVRNSVSQTHRRLYGDEDGDGQPHGELLALANGMCAVK